MEGFKDDNIIFIISLPRSGSTLLQRMLMSHKNISSKSECWILLPLMYSVKSQGVRAVYSHTTLRRAVLNLIEKAEEGKETWRAAINSYAKKFYKGLKGDENYFIDKTPRYHLIIDEITKCFPSSKFIFLLRNPVSIFGSIIDSLNSNSFRRMDKFDVDLKSGPKRISKAVSNTQNSILVRYEDIVNDTEKEISKLLGKLGVDQLRNPTKRLGNRKSFELGDKRGDNWEEIKDRTNYWKSVIDSPIRKHYAKQFVRNVCDDYMKLGQYSKKNIIKEIHQLKVSNLRLKEPVYIIEEVLYRYLNRLIYE